MKKIVLVFMLIAQSFCMDAPMDGPPASPSGSDDSTSDPETVSFRALEDMQFLFRQQSLAQQKEIKMLRETLVGLQYEVDALKAFLYVWGCEMVKNFCPKNQAIVMLYRKRPRTNAQIHRSKSWDDLTNHIKHPH